MIFNHGDGCRGWIVALASCWINLCLTGITRATGILYVEIITVFGTSREDSSWPFSLFNAVANFSGVFPGFMTQKMSIQRIVFCGTTITVLGFTLCFFATSVLWITIAFGVIAGFGTGVAITLIPVILTQHCKRNRASGNGIYQSGATLGVFILPGLYKYLLEFYDIRGTFLLLGGIVLHVYVAVLFLSPVKDQERQKPGKNNRSPSNLDRRYEDHGNDSHKRNCFTKKWIILCNQKTVDKENDKKDPFIVNTSKDDSTESENRYLEKRVTQSRDGAQNLFTANAAERFPQNCNILEVQNRENDSDSSNRSNKTTWTLCRDTLKDPFFIINTFSFVVARLVIVTFSLVIVDYVMDKNMSRERGVLLVTTMAVPELVGRLFSGWISDHKYMKRRNVFTIAQIISGLSLIGFTFVVSEPVLLFVLSTLFALANASAFILVNVLYFDYLGIERMPIALSLRKGINGAAAFLQSWLIGLFYDGRNSYNNLFYAMATASIASGAIWLLEPVIIKRKQRHQGTEIVTGVEQL